jgi:diguanylate cyclase (GGDEF)-like protein/PAS domain S-box-containing protein
LGDALKSVAWLLDRSEVVNGGTIMSETTTGAADGTVSSVDTLAAELVGSTTAFVCVIGADGRILLFNPALERATGWSSAEVADRLFWEVLTVPHEAALARDCIARAIATGTAPPQEGDWLDRWGGHRRVSMQNGVLLDRRGRPYAMTCVGFDVTQQRIAEARLQQRAASDPLTGLRNRAALLAALRGELTDPDSTGCGVLFCDLDGFKAANDTHGHQVGDLLLTEIAQRLTETCSSDDVVGRYGGDEFVVLARRSAATRVDDLRRGIEAAVGQPIDTPHGPVTLGISVGIAIGRAGDNSDDLIATADRHMYGVKTQRRTVRAA